MLVQSLARTLPGVRQTSGTPAVAGGTFGELICSEVNPAYYHLAKSGKVFTVSSLGVTIASFGGNGLSSPSFSMYNPPDNSNDAVIMSVRACFRSESPNAQIGFGWYFGNPAGGTMTMNGQSPIGAYGFSPGGSSVLAQCNQPITYNPGAGNNLVMVLPSFDIGQQSSPTSLDYGLRVDELKGSIVVPPGVVLCWGTITGGGFGVMDVSVTWAELPQ